MDVRYFANRIRTPDGRPVGTVYLYGSSLPATLLTLMTAGNRAMFERMARLISPGRRAAAVLFADVEASGALSRRLSSAAYFQLIRALTTAMDELVIDREGIVGKHAGDGVTAFFLAGDLGSPSGAAFACLDTARALSAVAREVAAGTDGVEPSDLRMNIGARRPAIESLATFSMPAENSALRYSRFTV